MTLTDVSTTEVYLMDELSKPYKPGLLVHGLTGFQCTDLYRCGL